MMICKQTLNLFSYQFSLFIQTCEVFNTRINPILVSKEKVVGSEEYEDKEDI